MNSNTADSARFERVVETRVEHPPALVHQGWAEAFPWLVQGTTTAGTGDVPFDLGLFSAGTEPGEVRQNWAALRRWTGSDRVVHARQLHGSEVHAHRADPGDRKTDPVLSEPCDGHATSQAGVLLAVTTADCVPVFVVDPPRRAVSAIHAGWRGAALGVLEGGLDLMVEVFETRRMDLYVHFGPAICGACYEVGPEVFQALHQPVPADPTPIDLRAVLVERAVAAGVDRSQVTVSGHCTRCTESGLFSHRGGDAGRQVGYLGVRPGARGS
jgi:YfiH family protein